MGSDSSWINDETKVKEVETLADSFGWYQKNDTPKKHAKIIELYKQGMPTKEIIYIVDLSIAAVNYVIRKHRLERQREVIHG